MSLKDMVRRTKPGTEDKCHVVLPKRGSIGAESREWSLEAGEVGGGTLESRYWNTGTWEKWV